MSASSSPVRWSGRARRALGLPLTRHLGLVTPNSEACRIFVDGEPYYWRDGEAVMFDETFIHRAENKRRSKLAHYTLKWLIIGGLLYWIFA